MSEPTISRPLPKPVSRLSQLRSENARLKKELAERDEAARLEQENARLRDQLETGRCDSVPRFPPGFRIGR